MMTVTRSINSTLRFRGMSAVFRAVFTRQYAAFLAKQQRRIVLFALPVLDRKVEPQHYRSPYAMYTEPTSSPGHFYPFCPAFPYLKATRLSSWQCHRRHEGRPTAH